jgi:hypothetical protein
VTYGVDDLLRGFERVVFLNYKIIGRSPTIIILKYYIIGF